jgi:uncharacterized protein (DUF302 family)
MPFPDALDGVRAALVDHGFGVLTEIDVTATMKAKLDADMENYVILGACNPTLAHQALEADRSVGLLLPCNVVVRSVGPSDTIVEILDPRVISQVSDVPGLGDVADQAAAKLSAALAEITETAAAA